MTLDKHTKLSVQRCIDRYEIRGKEAESILKKVLEIEIAYSLLSLLKQGKIEITGLKNGEIQWSDKT